MGRIRKPFSAASRLDHLFDSLPMTKAPTASSSGSMERTAPSNSVDARRFMETGGGGGGSSSRNAGKRRRSAGGGSIQLLDPDLLCSIFALLDHFDLFRCSVVCKSWNKIIQASSFLKELYYKRHPNLKNSSVKSDALGASMKTYFKELAMEEHKLGFLGGPAKIYHLNGHNERVNLCRMKRGSVLTGIGDRVVRLWSAENFNYLDQYFIPEVDPLIDFDFDENKIVGLTSNQVCIWKRHGQRDLSRLHEGIFSRGLCMRYIDPEVAVGCEDGRVCVYDMYSGRCSRIIRMHSDRLTCMDLTEDQLILCGSTFGNIAIADFSSGERLGLLKSSYSPTGMKSLCFNMDSHLLFAGSTSGYVHCWDLRTLRPLWETRVSPNVVYAVHHLPSDVSTLAIGGLDGVLRILNQRTGEVLSSIVVGADVNVRKSSIDKKQVTQKRVTFLPENSNIDRIPRHLRPPITSLAVGMKKIVTTHNDKFVRSWKFGSDN